MALFRCYDGIDVVWRESVDDPRSPRFKFETDRSAAMRTIDVPWEHWIRMTQSIIGDSFLTFGPPVTPAHFAATPPRGFSYISRNAPWSVNLINSTGKRFLWASSVEVEGRGVPLSMNQIGVGPEGKDSQAIYKDARLTVQFDTRPYDIMPDAEFIAASGNDVDESRLIRYVTKIYRPQGENLSLDGSTYYYGGLTNGGEPVALTRNVNKIILSYNLSITWHFVPLPAVPSIFFNSAGPNFAIDRCLGHVNHSLFSGMRRGTLLLMAAELRPIVSAFGNRVYDITYMFKFFSPTPDRFVGADTPGHNHIFRPFGSSDVPPSNGWYEVVASRALALSANPTNFVLPPAGQRDAINIYDFADFDKLFRPANWRA